MTAPQHPTFVARPNVIPALDRWYAFEVMLKANTPGMRDGQVTCWMDGEITFWRGGTCGVRGDYGFTSYTASSMTP